MTYWEVRASATGRWDSNIRVVASILPARDVAEARRRGATEEKFWQEADEKARRVASRAGLPSQAASQLIRRAKSNPCLETFLLIVY